LTAPSAAARLRAALASGPVVVAPGALDPLTARAIERLGFPAVYLGGNAMGLNLGVGQPLLTLTEAVECARRVVAAVGVPVVADADAGFGDAAHTRRAVTEFERAGVAAIHMEDQPFPKRAHYHIGRGRLAPVEEMAEKLRVAVASRRDPDFLVIARTDALRVTGSLDEVAARGRTYQEAGADLLLVLDLEPTDAGALRDRLPEARLAWIGGVSGPGPDAGELEAAGFALALYPFNTVAAVIQAVEATWAPVRAGNRLPQTAEQLAAAQRVVAELVPLGAYLEIEARTTERSS
jgi:2-methylisocitrate lyase-like PEP mutase family enzyme